MIDWKRKSKDTQAVYGTVKHKYKLWKELNKSWDGFCLFCDYPPRIEVDFTLHGINRLSDCKLLQLGEWITEICKEHGFGAYKSVRGNTCTYKIFFTNDNYKHE